MGEPAGPSVPSIMDRGGHRADARRGDGIRLSVTQTSAQRRPVPTFCLARAAVLTHNAGMGRNRADKSRRPIGRMDPGGQLRRAGLGAFFRPSQLEAVGLTRAQLPALIRAGRVEHTGRGLYRLSDVEPTEDYSLAMACARVPTSVVCLLSALRVHGIGTQVPAQVWLAIPHKARVPRLPDLRLRIVRFSGAAWAYGVKDIEFEGVPARITGPVRTIVDCFRFERLVGPEVPIEALQDGLRQRKVTIADLAAAEDILPSRRLRAILDLRTI